MSEGIRIGNIGELFAKVNTLAVDPNCSVEENLTRIRVVSNLLFSSCRDGGYDAAYQAMTAVAASRYHRQFSRLDF